MGHGLIKFCSACATCSGSCGGHLPSPLLSVCYILSLPQGVLYGRGERVSQQRAICKGCRRERLQSPKIRFYLLPFSSTKSIRTPSPSWVSIIRFARKQSKLELSKTRIIKIQFINSSFNLNNVYFILFIKIEMKQFFKYQWIFRFEILLHIITLTAYYNRFIISKSCYFLNRPRIFGFIVENCCILSCFRGEILHYRQSSMKICYFLSLSGMRPQYGKNKPVYLEGGIFSDIWLPGKQ